MQDRYARDIGDYVKLSLLRHIAAGKRLGILWWLYPDESHNADGKHIGYLQQPQLWRASDPALFDALQRIVVAGERRVAALQNADLFEKATYYDEAIPTVGLAADRRDARRLWFARAANAVDGCEIVFLDPDNGLETSRFDTGRAKAGKSVALAELAALSTPGRTLIVYHHHTRMAGGHQFELRHWAARLTAFGFEVDALRASIGSSRAFFFLNASDEIRGTALEFAERWMGKVSWHPSASLR